MSNKIKRPFYKTGVKLTKIIWLEFSCVCFKDKKLAKFLESTSFVNYLNFACCWRYNNDSACENNNNRLQNNTTNHEEHIIIVAYWNNSCILLLLRHFKNVIIAISALITNLIFTTINCIFHARIKTGCGNHFIMRRNFIMNESLRINIIFGKQWKLEHATE